MRFHMAPQYMKNKFSVDIVTYYFRELTLKTTCSYKSSFENLVSLCNFENTLFETKYHLQLRIQRYLKITTHIARQGIETGTIDVLESEYSTGNNTPIFINRSISLSTSGLKTNRTLRCLKMFGSVSLFNFKKILPFVNA